MDIFGIILATLVYLIIGFLWYGPIYGKEWKKLTTSKSKKITVWSFIGALLIGLLFSVTLWVLNGFVMATDFVSGLTLGLIVSIGVVFPVIMSLTVWEGKSPRLVFVNTAYFIISLAIMGGLVAIS